MGKIYRYCLFTRRASSAFVSRYCWHLPGELDVAAMNSGARYLIGSHDFASFQAAGSSVRDTRRTVRHLFCRRQGPLVTITCVGDGFLYKMVRIIVGSLVEIGLGTAPTGWARCCGQRRQLAGPTAPAHGLVLERVSVPPVPEQLPPSLVTSAGSSLDSRAAVIIYQMYKSVSPGLYRIC